MRRALLLLPLLIVGALGAVAPAAAAPAPAATDRWALIIGVDRFQGATRSNYGAVNDGADFRQMLLRAGWADDHIKVLNDSAATAAGIRAGMQWLVDRSGPGTLSVMHYSGHVKQVRSTEYLWPHDNRFIADTEVAGFARQLRGQAWIDISGCEGAGFDEGISGPTRLFTASSRATEKSYESVDLRQSIFTHLLVEQGMLQGLADADRNGRVSVQEAFAYAAPRAPQMTAHARQGPQHPVIAGGDGTPLFLDAVSAASTPAAVAAQVRPRTCIIFICF